MADTGADIQEQIGTAVLCGYIVNSALQSETTVAKATHEDSEVGLSDTVAKPDNFEELAEEQGSISRTKEEFSIEENAAIVIQATWDFWQVQMSEESQAVQQHIQQKRQLHIYSPKSQDDWDHSLATLDELQAKLQNKQDAATRREKALAYASLQQELPVSTELRQLVAWCMKQMQE